jgi:hypothetical protein
VLLLLFAPAVLAIDQEAVHTPQLLLNAQRLRRLKRDRERKTVRWVNFENRVNTVPDSPERGFELALYYAVTGDEAKGREAVRWALAHNSPRQNALVLDWCSPLVSAEKKKLTLSQFVIAGHSSYELLRDSWFNQVASGRDPSVPVLSAPSNSFILSGYRNPEELYALCELIYTVRAATHTDLRDTNPHFFSTLPAELLLSAKPRELNSPPWMLHIAALALVAIDPNLPASQFLQSWALEDSQTLRDGPGVAYELLWADPYLPGVGYQNMDTWVYDESGRLFARANWEPDSCWIEISPQAMKQENCPPNWQSEVITFGHLTLIPMTARCVEIPHAANNESVLVWKLRPGQKIVYGKGKEQRTSAADAAGMWRPSAYVEDRACLAPH